MADINAILQAKHFGVPTWLLATGVVAVGAGVVLYMRQKKSSGTDTSQNATSDPAADVGQGGVGSPLTGFPVPFSDGATTVINNPPGSTSQDSGPNIPSAISDLQMGQYIVKGITSNVGISDQYPLGVGQIVYGHSASSKTPAGETGLAAEVAADGVRIELANPGIIPPYPKGTVLRYPLEPEHLSGPVSQTTSTTQFTAPTPVIPDSTINSASGA